MRLIGILAGLTFALFATLVNSAESNPALTQPSADATSRRFIVKMKPAVAKRIKIKSGSAS